MPTMLPKVDGDRLARQLEIGAVEEVPIDAQLRKCNLLTAVGLKLPGQVELYAEAAGCYVYQGGAEIDDGAWALPAKLYRLAAGERRFLIVASELMSRIAIQRSTANDGTLVITNTVRE